MYQCFACNTTFPTNSELLHHVGQYHSHLSSFKCNEKNCSRIFSLLNSYQKHRKTCHKDYEENSVNITKPLSSEHKNPLENDNEIMECDTVDSFVNATPNCDTNNMKTFSENISTENSIYNDSSIFNSVVGFISKLHSYPDIPRKRVINIVQDFDNFLNFNLEPLQNIVDERLKILNDPEDSRNEIKNRFNEIKNSFCQMKTEFLQFKKLEELETFIPPKQILLGERDEFKEINGNRKLVHVKCTAEFIPIRSVLKKFFETKDYYIRTIANYKSLLENSEITSNFVQASLWKNKINSLKHENTLPLYLYFDDYENNNPLGTHAGIQKCGAVYVSIPCLPPEFSSKLNSIFLFVLFNSLDHKLFKNERIFHKVKKELIFLEEEGIEIRFCSSEGNVLKEKLYLKLCLIIGDNLGLHSILGFTESFSSKFSCRFCMLDSNNYQNCFKENKDLVRSRLNYEEQKQLGIKHSGISEECIFHVNFSDFHVTENVSVDVMHDIFEGICQYDMSKVLHHLIFVDKVFSLEQLNQRIMSFQFNRWDNRPPQITESQLKSKLKMSSSEMRVFMNNLGVLIGDFIPADSLYWPVYKNLKKIIDILLLDAYQKNLIDFLTLLIEEYLSELQILFPNSFKPKHHYLTHYPRVMEQVGPLWKSCSIRYESKHRFGKSTSRTAICRINICHTIAIKTQLKLNYDFLTAEFTSNVWESGPIISIAEITNENIRNALPSSSTFSLLKWIRFYHKKIFPESVIIFPSGEDGIQPIAYLIKAIFLSNEVPSFIVSKFEVVFFDVHYQAYYVEGSSQLQILNIDLMENFRLSSFIQNIKNNLYIVT